MADLLKFIHEDPQQVVDEMKAELEDMLNRQIAPADLEMLIINAFAYRETLLRASINDVGRLNLVSFSRGAALEYLGGLVGVTRLPASSALVTIQFSIIEGHTGITIPEGVRVQSTDGKAIFETMGAVVVGPGVYVAEVSAACTTSGTIGNGYAANTISIILDPKPYLVSAKNIDVSAGGADQQTDDKLRERIQLAPASFSVAGPNDAYKYFAKSTSSSIVDVAITSPVPGQVNIYPLLSGGTLPSQAILDQVYSICNADKVRPLTDTVIVGSPAVIDYSINIELTILTDAVNLGVDAVALSALQAWVDARKERLGVDVVRNRLMTLSMAEGVYSASVVSPSTDIVANPEVYTRCTGITVSIVGTHDE